MGAPPGSGNRAGIMIDGVVYPLAGEPTSGCGVARLGRHVLAVPAEDVVEITALGNGHCHTMAHLGE